MAEIFRKNPPGYPRYAFAYDTRRNEVVIEMASSTIGNVPEKIYLDNGLIEALQKYAEEAGL